MPCETKDKHCNLWLIHVHTALPSVTPDWSVSKRLLPTVLRDFQWSGSNVGCQEYPTSLVPKDHTLNLCRSYLLILGNTKRLDCYTRNIDRFYQLDGNV